MSIERDIGRHDIEYSRAPLGYVICVEELPDVSV